MLTTTTAKQEIMKALTIKANTLLRSKTDSSKGKKLFKLIDIINDCELNNYGGIRKTLNGYYNIGDVCECLTKFLIKQDGKASVSSRIGVDFTNNHKRYEIKSAVIEPTTTYKPDNNGRYSNLVIFTVDGIKYIDREKAKQFRDKRITPKQANEI